MFTGGGSAGHVTVNLALMPRFLQEGWDVSYIGSEQGIEKQLVSSVQEVKYYGIATGKLRRYFDWKNVSDPFRVVKGVYQAYRLIHKHKPQVIFSKGGFVSVPVILGAWLNRVPVVIHESDYTPGLANRISLPFASRVCTTFPETIEHLRTGKAAHVGAIVRDELMRGVAQQGLDYCSFRKQKPVLMVMGGSLGARRINAVIRDNLDQLLADYQIVHICGKGNVSPDLEREGYKQFEYVQAELPHLMAMADLVVSRAGSNSIFEWLALRKPMLLIPLSRQSSRGDQILNAESFAKSGFGMVLEEEALTNESFLEAIGRLYKERDQFVKRMSKQEAEEPISKVIDIIRQAAAGK